MFVDVPGKEVDSAKDLEQSAEEMRVAVRAKIEAMQRRVWEKYKAIVRGAEAAPRDLAEIVAAALPLHRSHAELAPLSFRIKAGAANGPLKIVCACGKLVKISRLQQALFGVLKEDQSEGVKPLIR